MARPRLLTDAERIEHKRWANRKYYFRNKQRWKYIYNLSTSEKALYYDPSEWSYEDRTAEQEQLLAERGLSNGYASAPLPRPGYAGDPRLLVSPSLRHR